MMMFAFMAVWFPY